VASKTPFVVYVLPIILSVGLGAVVMAEALNNSDRTLNMWQFNQSGISEVSTETIQVIGLQTQYTTSESVDLQIKLNDDTFDCGDLYITIYKISNTSKEVVTQSGFLNQCYDKDGSYLPINEKYSEVLSEQGKYEIFIEIYNKTYKQTDSLVANITVN
tara:strand:- start:152 stop:625 length:474 start_codon:yes stop_codon:yes gene_type:complete